MKNRWPFFSRLPRFLEGPRLSLIRRRNRAVVLLGAIQLSACAVDTLAIASFVSDAGEPLDSAPSSGTTCTRNEHCPAGEYCARQSCHDARGKCQLRPSRCDAGEAPVCGCDHLVYLNACLLSQSGVSLASEGTCDEPVLCEGPDRLDCPAGTFCGLLLSSEASRCPPDVTGMCWVLPEECSEPSGPARFKRCGDAPNGRGRPSPGPDAGDDDPCSDLCTAVRSQRLHQRADDCSG